MRPELMNAVRSMQKNTAGELPDHMTSQLITKETQTYSNLVFIYCYETQCTDSYLLISENKLKCSGKKKAAADIFYHYFVLLRRNKQH